MKDENKQEERQMWKKRIEELNSSGLTVIEYAKANEFSTHQVYYWKTKLSRRRNHSIPLKPEQASSIVKVIPKTTGRSNKLPDPKWVAGFVKALSEDF